MSEGVLTCPWSIFCLSIQFVFFWLEYHLHVALCIYDSSLLWYFQVRKLACQYLFVVTLSLVQLTFVHLSPSGCFWQALVMIRSFGVIL